MARNDHDHSQGRHALRISAELAAKRTASLKTGRNLRSLRSEPLTASDGRLMTDLRGSVMISDSLYAETHQCFLPKSILKLKTREKQENCRDFKSTSQEVHK